MESALKYAEERLRARSYSLKQAWTGSPEEGPSKSPAVVHGNVKACASCALRYLSSPLHSPQTTCKHRHALPHSQGAF